VDWRVLWPNLLLMVPLFLNEAGSTGPRRLDISWPTTEFIRMVKSWDKFDEVKMGIFMRHIKKWVEESHSIGLRLTTRVGPAFRIMCSKQL